MPLANRANERPFTLDSYLYGFTPFDKKDSLFKAIELVDSIENGDASAFANYKYTDGNSPSIDESFFGHFRIVESNGEVDEIRVNNVDLLNKDNSQEIFNFINTGANTSILFKNNSNQNIGFFKVNNAVFENNYTVIKVDQVIYLSNFTNEQEYSFDLNFIKKSISEVASFSITFDSQSDLITEFNNSSKFYLQNPENTLVEANFSTSSGISPAKSNTKIYQLITKTENGQNDLFEGDFGFESQQIQGVNLKLVYSDELSTQESTIFTINSPTNLQTDIANIVNTGPSRFIADISSAYIRVILTPSLTTKIYKIISKPDKQNSLITSGNFGTGGQTITYHNLELVRQELQASSNDLENAPGTVTENFGDLGTTSVKDYVNGLTTGLTLINSTDTLTVIKAIVDGLDVSYRYVGGDATYGANDLSIADSNLDLLEQETDGIPDNSIEEIKFTQAVRDKINPLQATPETLATATQITVPLDRIMGTDFTATVTDIETFDIDSNTIVNGGYAIYAIQTSAEPTINGAIKQVFMSDQEAWDNTQIYTLHIWKESSQVNYNIVKRNV